MGASRRVSHRRQTSFGSSPGDVAAQSQQHHSAKLSGGPVAAAQWETPCARQRSGLQVPSASRRFTHRRMCSAPGTMIQPAPAVAQMPRLSDVEILAAVSSLYDDELRPYGRILRKRLVERACAHGGAGAGENCVVDVGALRQLCWACAALRFESGEGGEWFVLLVGRPSNFVEIYSPTDVYPESFWAAAEEYLTAPGPSGGADLVLPGGRYLCAQVLLSLKLEFLAGRTLGQVCHVVQLAVTQKKLLGYLDGGVVPYARSTSMLKKMCAERQQPCGPKGNDVDAVDTLHHASWDVARTIVRELLQSAIQRGDKQVPLSNIKRLFRSVYHMELSETKLGHTRLSELLQDLRFQDICTVQLQSRGYAVLPALPPVAMEAEFAPCDCEVRHPMPLRPASPSALSKDLAAGGMLRGTFIHAMPPAPTPMRQAPRRSQSVPKDMGLCQGRLELCANEGSPCTDEPVCYPEPDGRFILKSEAQPRVVFCADEPLCLEDAGPSLEEPTDFPIMTPTPFPIADDMSAYTLALPAPVLADSFGTVNPPCTGCCASSATLEPMPYVLCIAGYL